MEAGHERSAGEWQIEWQAVPMVCRSSAGALRATTELVEGLRVFPDRMRANLEADGGRIMAEAYMFVLAAHLGRDRAHELLYQAVRDSRGGDQPLRVALCNAVTPQMWATIEPHLPEPTDYLGSTATICAASRPRLDGRTRDDNGRVDPTVTATAAAGLAELAAMQRIRSFEERVRELRQQRQVIGSVHLCIGQEAIPVGACAALEPQDAVFATYRGHGWALATRRAAGGGVRRAAWAGQPASTAAAAGRPTSRHAASGFYGENSIVGRERPDRGRRGAGRDAIDGSAGSPSSPSGTARRTRARCTRR